MHPRLTYVSYKLAGLLKRDKCSSPSQDERNLRLFYWDTAFNGVVGAGTGTFLTVYMARIGASSFMISALTAIPALVTVLVSLPASMWVEQQHNQVKVTTSLRYIFRSTYLILVFLLFLPQEYVAPAIVLLWSIQAIPMAATVLSWTSVVGDIVPAHRRAQVNGERWALLSIVSAGAVALFGKLLDAPLLTFPWNYQVVFLVSAAASAVSTVLFSRIKVETDYAPKQPVHLSLRARVGALFAPMVHSSEFIHYLSGTFLVRVGIAMPTALFSIFWVDDLQASDTLIGVRTTVGQIALIAGYYLFGRWATRWGHGVVLIASSVGLGVYPMVTALAPSPWWLLPAALFWGFFSGGINISFFEGLLVNTPAEKRPSFAALNAVFANLATFLGPLFGALVMELSDIRVAFFVSGALHLIGALLCWRLGVGRRPTPP